MNKSQIIEHENAPSDNSLSVLDALTAADVFPFLEAFEQNVLRGCSTQMCEAFDVASHVLLTIAGYTMSQPSTYPFVFGVATIKESSSSLFAELHSDKTYFNDDEVQNSSEKRRSKPSRVTVEEMVERGQRTRWCFAPALLTTVDGRSVYDMRHIKSKDDIPQDPTVEEKQLATQNDDEDFKRIEGAPASVNLRKSKVTAGGHCSLPLATIVNLDVVIENRYYFQIQRQMLANVSATKKEVTTDENAERVEGRMKPVTSGVGNESQTDNTSAGSSSNIGKVYLDNLLAGLDAHCIIISHCNSVLEIGDSFLKGTTAKRVIFGNHSTIFASTSWDKQSSTHSWEREPEVNIVRNSKNNRTQKEEEILPLDRIISQKISGKEVYQGANTTTGTASTPAPLPNIFPSANHSYSYRFRREIQVEYQQYQHQSLKESVLTLSTHDNVLHNKNFNPHSHSPFRHHENLLPPRTSNHRPFNHGNNYYNPIPEGGVAHSEKYDPALLIQSLPKKSVMVSEKVPSDITTTPHENANESFQIISSVAISNVRDDVIGQQVTKRVARTRGKSGSVHKQRRIKEYYSADALRPPTRISIAAIGDGFLSECDNLLFVDFRGFIQLHSIGSEFLSRCKAIKKITNLLGLDETRTIGNNFLYKCDALQDVNFCDLVSLVTVGDNWLSKCANLTSVEIAHLLSLKTVGQGWLAQNPLLTDVAIGPLSSLRIVGHGWLNRCANLEVVTFRQFQFLEQVGDGWLGECTGLRTVKFAPNEIGSQKLVRHQDEALDGQLLSSGGFELVGTPSTSESPVATANGTATGNTFALSTRNSSVQLGLQKIFTKSVSSPAASVTPPLHPSDTPTRSPKATTGNSNRNSTHSLATVSTPTFPRLKRVGSHWLYNCQTLESIDYHAAGMPSLSTIGNFWMALCPSLISVNLFGLDSLSAVGANWLVGAHSLRSIDVGVLPELRIINSNFLCDCRSLSTITFSAKLKNLTTVGNRFVSNLPNLLSISFNGLKNLTSIGDGFLSECPILISVDFTDLKNLQSVGKDWFKGSVRVAAPPQLPLILRKASPDLSRRQSFNGSSTSSRNTRSQTATATNRGGDSTLDGGSFDHEQDDLYADEVDNDDDLDPKEGKLLISEVSVMITLEGGKGQESREIESDFLFVTDLEEEKRKRYSQISARRGAPAPSSLDPPIEAQPQDKANNPSHHPQILHHVKPSHGYSINKSFDSASTASARATSAGNESRSETSTNSRVAPTEPAQQQIVKAQKSNGGGFFSFLKRKKTPEEKALKAYQQSVKEYNQRVSAMFAPLLPHLLGVAGKGSGLSKKQKDVFLRQMLATAQQLEAYNNDQ